MEEESAMPTMEVERREEPTEIGAERVTRLLQRMEGGQRVGVSEVKIDYHC